MQVLSLKSNVGSVQPPCLLTHVLLPETRHSQDWVPTMFP